MPVVLQTPFVSPAPTFDKVHLDSLSVTLERTQYAKGCIQMRIRLYYQDPETGIKTYSPEVRDVSIEDAEAFASELAMSGNMQGVDAMTHIKSLVALLVSTSTDLGSATSS